MGWCDKLASTPSVGLRFVPHFLSGDSILSSLTPLLDKWMDGDKLTFQIAQHDSFGVQFTTNDGFHYGFEAARIFVEFRHRMKTKAVSGGPPTVQLISSALPFSELLPLVSARLLEATLLLPTAKTRTLNRIGVTSTTLSDEKDFPPGIARFISYVGRPWSGDLGPYNFQIVADIKKGAGWTDRCIHHIIKTDDPDQLPTLKFDWQRTFSSGKTITQTSLKELLETAEVESVKYFEDLAEGNRFDEDLLNKTT